MEKFPYVKEGITRKSLGEVSVEQGQLINDVFDRLDALGVRIRSMRNRANRLEEMFVNLVEGAA